MLLRAALLVVLFHLASSTSDGQFRVKNGMLARLGKYPAVVLLISKPDRTGSVSMCTGTIVHDNVVITAAHCLCGDAKGVELVIPGTLKIDSPLTEYDIVEKKIHPTAEANCRRGDKAFGEHDIALVRTATNIDLDCRNVDKTSLNFDNNGGSQTITIVGYGVDEKGNSGVLKEGVLKTMPNCNEMNSDLSAICYDASPSANWQVSGSGDSGCAAFDGQMRVIGINSGKRVITSIIGRSREEREYGVMASVKANESFLKGVLKGWGISTTPSASGTCSAKPPTAPAAGKSTTVGGLKRLPNGGFEIPVLIL